MSNKTGLCWSAFFTHFVEIAIRGPPLAGFHAALNAMLPRLRPLHAPVRKARKARLLARVNGLLAGPGPAAEARPLEVRVGLLDLRARAHHERPVLHDGLVDGSALQEQQLALVRCERCSNGAKGKNRDAYRKTSRHHKRRLSKAV